MALPHGTRTKRARFSPDGRRVAAIRPNRQRESSRKRVRHRRLERDSPVIVANVFDGSFVRVVVASVGGRPRSLVVDGSGHFYGDPELERAILYASGTSLRAAVVLTSADLASEFRRAGQSHGDP